MSSKKLHWQSPLDYQIARDEDGLFGVRSPKSGVRSLEEWEIQLKTHSQNPPFLVRLYYNGRVGESTQQPSQPPMESSFHPMNKHYILQLNPNASHDWDRCTLRDALTGGRPDLARLIAEAVGEQAGSYLVAVNIEVQVLQQAPVLQPERVTLDVPVVAPAPQLKELVA